MHLAIEKTVKAPLKVVFDWWTELRPEDANLVKPLKNRRIVKKEDGVILAEDFVKILGRSMKYSVKVTLKPPDVWIAEYSGRVADAVSTYRLIETPDGTKIFYTSEIKPKGMFTRLVSPFIKGLVRRVFEKEMNDYNRALEEEWRRNRAQTDKP